MNNSSSPLRNDTLLDNPIWNSLTASHAHLAVGAHTGHSLACRYPADIGPLSAFQQPTPQAYADLAAIVPEGDVAVLFLQDPVEAPPGWELLRSGPLVQMICNEIPNQPSLADAIVPLKPADFPEMVALATLTEPGPFRDRTATLGEFLGVRMDGRLVAMAGQRLSPTGFVEVSGVCTHPDFRGRGYAQALVAAVARTINAEGRTPFLTAIETNTRAVRVYEQVGFVIRRTLQLAVLKPPPPTRRQTNRQ